jgi:hypothetical protein
MNSLMVALVLWNGLLLVALEVLITRRKQVMRWVKGLDRCDRSSWERDHRGSGRSPSSTNSVRMSVAPHAALTAE